MSLEVEFTSTRDNLFLTEKPYDIKETKRNKIVNIYIDPFPFTYIVYTFQSDRNSMSPFSIS